MPEHGTVIVGMGEIGSVFYSLLEPVCKKLGGVDSVKEKCKGDTDQKNVNLLHICIPFTEYDKFAHTVIWFTSKYNPKELIIHSSVEPTTTERLQLTMPDVLVVYSPWRGVHKRMTVDMTRYTKYYSSPKVSSLFIEQMKQVGIPTKRWGDLPKSLELAKLLMDVTYYGWLIIFAQHVKTLADKFNVDDKKLWDFTDEIQKFLGNRPRMFSGEGIGGHCVMQGKALLNDVFLDMVFSHDEYYRRNMKNAR